MHSCQAVLSSDAACQESHLRAADGLCVTNDANHCIAFYWLTARSVCHVLLHISNESVVVHGCKTLRHFDILH